MAAVRWSDRPRVEKYQIVFGVLGLIASMFFVLDANFFVRIIVLFVGALIGSGVGYVIAKATGGPTAP